MNLRRAFAAALVAGLGIGFASCDVAVSPYAAKVNGETITPNTVFSAVGAINADADFRCVLISDPSGSVAVKGTGPSTYNKGLAASVLTTLVESRILDRSLTDRGLRVTPLATSIAQAQLGAALSPPSNSMCTASGAKLLSELRPSYRNALVRVQADNDVISAQLAGFQLNSTSIASFGVAHPRLTERACVSTIEVANKANAQKAETAIARGQSFAAAATKYSLSAGARTNGGSLGCYQPLQFASPFDSDVRALSVGQTSSPVSFQGEYVLIHVDSRESATSAQTALAGLSELSAHEQTVADSIERQANVQVSPDFGYWGASKGNWQVIPPTGPSDALVANATAITPSVNHP